uniref:Uncharacterized protein n=1 Tax=Panagrolaimus davidi TaxID=227884 RepID=A0A914PLA8_9BILA
MYTLRSSIDQKEFKIDQKVINASTLLKNICEITDINQPIVIKCPSQSLDIYIKFINHCDELSVIHDKKFEDDLYKEYGDEKLVSIANELSILDSDFVFDSIADLFLDRIKEMKWQNIKGYLEVEDDFTLNERKLLEENRIEYLLSIDFGEIKFPFAETSFITLQNKLYTPLNALLSRIIQRSDSTTSFNLSVINKTIKNENDRHPI